jgi:succinate-acetate transporter protein
MEIKTVKKTRKRTQLLVGLSALAIAAVLFTLSETKYVTMVGSGNVAVYPAAFFGLLGVIQIYRSLRN